MQFDQQFLMMAGLAVLIVGALFYAFSYKSLQLQKKADQRRKSFQVDKKTKVKVQNKRMDEKQRRKMREESLKTLDAKKQKDREATKPDLQNRIYQAGMTTPVRRFYLYCVLMGLGMTFILFIFAQLPIHLAAGFGLIAGAGLPNWFVSFKRKRRFKKFIAELPNSLDVIVRGIKSGLPLNDCLRIIASDAEEPVRSEFRQMIESTQVGLTVPEAVYRLYENVPTQETNFLAIIISIQAQAGGNLSEALANLTGVLRERKKMADKIKAFSTEAKASAYIIGSLPFVVAILLMLTSPGYLDPMFNTYAGNKAILFASFLMVVGIGSMKKMISFKF